MNNSKRLIVALDVPTLNEAHKFVRTALDPDRCRVKIGYELFLQAGSGRYIDDLRKQGFGVFLDLKLNDIPNTVASAVRSAADLGIWALSLHITSESVLRAARAAADASEGAPLLVGITVLTSEDERCLKEDGREDGRVAELVFIRAQRAVRCGLDGVVCSPHELPLTRNIAHADFLRITPGIRPEWSIIERDDQERTMTPAETVRGDATHLVVGRPITQSADPKAAFERILKEIEETR